MLAVCPDSRGIDEPGNSSFNGRIDQAHVRVYVHAFNRIGSAVRKSMDGREHCLATVQQTGKESRLPKINSGSLKRCPVQFMKCFGAPPGSPNGPFLTREPAGHFPTQSAASSRYKYHSLMLEQVHSEDEPNNGC